MASNRLSSMLRALGLAMVLLGPVLAVSACSPGDTPRPGSAPVASQTGATGGGGQHK